MLLFFDQPDEDKTAPRLRPGLEHANFWTMSQSEVERMCATLDPNIWTTRTGFQSTIGYSAEEYELIEQNSGIYHFGWRHHVKQSRVRVTFKIVHYSKDKFDWDSKLDCAMPIDASKFIMTTRGWDWKEMPHFRLDWIRYHSGPPPIPAFFRRECKPVKRARIAAFENPPSAYLEEEASDASYDSETSVDEIDA